ncbi:MAG: stage II sporulation protein M [Saprospiraceae bacterium]|nr:stage II sporulation protein M [Saprospiraceae bacterium]
MKESWFIEQNKAKWKEFEQLLKEKEKNPAKLSRLFIQISDDLSYARTFYRNRSVRPYLNGVVQFLYHLVNKGRRFSAKGFVNFWKTDLPLIVYRSKREFLISFLLFFLSFLIGVLSTAKDPGFSTLILGQGYIDMTLKNIENGEPMAVYNSYNEFEMFFSITLNNLQVSFYTFVSGLLMALGTLFVLIYNGVMVGTFQYFFIEKGLFWESFLTIWQHGTIEISCIIIAGAAGLTLGKGLLFPGTYSRFQAFKITARRGLQIMAGIVPLIILAAFIEGYFTRHTDAPDFLRIIVILVSLMFILGYFGWYPRKVARKLDDIPPDDYKLKAPDDSRINYAMIFSLGELVTNTFKFFRQNIGIILKTVSAISILYTVLIVYVLDVFKIRGFETIMLLNYNIIDLFDYDGNFKLLSINIFTFFTITVIFSFLVNVFYKENIKIGAGKSFFHFFIRNGWKYFVVFLFLNYLIMLNFGWGIFFGLTVLPFSIFLTNVFAVNKLALGSGFKECFKLLKENWGRLILIYLIFGILSLVLTKLVSTPWFQNMLDIFLMNIDFEKEKLILFMLSLKIFLTIFILMINMGLLVTGITFLYYVVVELNTADDLLKRIDKFGLKNKLLGYERET